LPESQDHTYADKYALAELVTQTSIAAQMNALERLGLKGKSLDTALEWVHKDLQPVKLVLEAQLSHEFPTEKEKEVVDQDVETVNNGVFYGSSSFRTKIIRRVKEYHWAINISYEMLICEGNCQEKKLVLRTRDISTTLVTATDAPPPSFAPVSLDVNISWFLRAIAPENKRIDFRIDRGADTCRTPTRNEDVEEAIKFQRDISSWSSVVATTFQRLERYKDTNDTTVPLKISKPTPIFPPIVPWMENRTILSTGTLERFLEEHGHSLDKNIDAFSDSHAPARKDRMISVEEAAIVLVLSHVEELTVQYLDGIGYVEDLLMKQLIQAIGRRVTADDFNDFMRFHSKRFFGPDYVPKPFSHAIRQPEEHPVGVLSVERANGKREPAETLIKHFDGGTPIRIPIDAATSVEITGDRYLTGWMRHRFESERDEDQTVLAARARQFSSYLVLVGTVTGKDTFDPKQAIILQNKDEVLIPLLTEVLPSAKEFRDAIASLSPEQQAFARAFRAMQLESSVFGVCVVQLKPQLEKLLRLPNGALSKEVQLTEDLMSLFIDYQIPSDLLSFDGDAESSVSDKVSAVKGYVKGVMDIIENTKEKQLADEAKKAKMRAKMRDEEDEGEAVHEMGYTKVKLSVAFDEPMLMMATSTSGRIPSGSPSAEPSSAPSSGPSRSRSGAQTASRSFHGSNRDQSAFEAASFETDSVSSEPPSEGKLDAERFIDTERSSPEDSADDFTQIPKLLDAKLEKYDTDGYLRSTILKVGSVWTRKRQENLLTTPRSFSMRSSEIDAEKKKAFDLLDAISRSGTLSIESSALHIIIAVTHHFERSIIATLIEDNINPIEKVEKSALMLASTIFGEPASNLVRDDATRERLLNRFPDLFEKPTSKGKDKATSTE